MKIVNLNTTKTARVYIDYDSTITLVSYSTPVITIDPEGWLTCNGLYSATTIKHISKFMRAYTNGDYYDAKSGVLPILTSLARRLPAPPRTMSANSVPESS